MVYFDFICMCFGVIFMCFCSIISVVCVYFKYLVVESLCATKQPKMVKFGRKGKLYVVMTVRLTVMTDVTYLVGQHIIKKNQ